MELLVPTQPAVDIRYTTDGARCRMIDTQMTLESSGDGGPNILIRGLLGYNVWFENRSALALGLEFARVARLAQSKLTGPGFTFRHNNTGAIVRFSTAVEARLVGRMFELRDAAGDLCGDLLPVDDYLFIDSQPVEPIST